MAGVRVDLVVLVVVVTTLASAFGVVASSPPVPPPPCVVDDRPARPFPDGEATWTVLDVVFALPSSWEPPDLVSIREAGFDDDRSIRAAVVPDLRALREAAEADGIYLEVQSAYRSHAYQEATFARWVQARGYDVALATSARAGHSEHQLGTALDVRTAGGPAPWDVPNWATTPEGAWMVANGPSFGFVMSYPEGASDLTCYDFEPWHWRWVGRRTAEDVMSSGLTLRAYLWEMQQLSNTSDDGRP